MWIKQKLIVLLLSKLYTVKKLFCLDQSGPCAYQNGPCTDPHDPCTDLLLIRVRNKMARAGIMPLTIRTVCES